MSKTTLTVVLLFLILSLLLTYPLPLHLGGAVEDRQDALLNVWIVAWDAHQLLADPLHLFDANIFYPQPRTLAYSELLLGNALLALPLTAASGNPVLGYNLALLLSFFLSALGAYLLVARLTGSPGAGLVAGVAFAFSSYRLTNLAQAQLLSTQWLPLALLALHNLLRRPQARSVAIFCLFFCLQALSSFYYAMILALAVVVLCLVDLGQRLVARQPGRAYRPVLLHLALAAGLCLVVIVPFALPYFQVQRELGFERSLADSEPFSASLRQFALVPPGSLLHGLWLPSDDRPMAGGYPVDALFPGLIVLGLAAWGLARGRGRARWSYLALAVVALLLSLGPRLYLAPGRPAGPDLPLPYAWLYYLLPGFKALRAPVRFDVLLSLSLAVLSGYGLLALGAQTQVAVLARRWPGRRRLLAAAGLLLVALEVAVWPAARVEPVPVGRQVPAVYRWLAEQPAGSGSAILELPMAFTPGGPQLDYQYLSAYHWWPTPDGYSGFVPPAHGQVVYEMERFPSERAVSLLQALGVEFVVLHGDRLPAGRLAAIDAALPGVPGLAPVADFGQDRVLRVAPRAFDPAALEVSVYWPPRAAAGQPYTAYLLVRNRGEQSHALRPTDRLQPAVTWQGDERTEARPAVELPLVLSPAGGTAVVPLPLQAPEAQGTYHLTAGETDGLLGTWSAAGSVEVGAEGETDFPVPAQLVAAAVAPRARPGEPLAVDLTWRALAKIDAYYSVYVKLVDAQGQALAGWDGQPGNGQAPTLLWLPGELVPDRVTLNLPPDLPPGDYAVVVGMYRAEDLARALTLDAAGRPVAEVQVGTVRLEP